MLKQSGQKGIFAIDNLIGNDAGGYVNVLDL